MSTNESAIRWDFYRGAYGPSILGQLPDRAAVDLLRNIFLRVAATGAPIYLRNEPRMKLGNIAELVLVRAAQPSKKTLSRTGDATFVWSCSSDEWDTLAGMLEPFLDGQPGHQYLTAEGTDDALIEVSFGEEHPG